MIQPDNHPWHENPYNRRKVPTFGQAAPSLNRTPLEREADSLKDEFAKISGGYSLASVMRLTPGAGFLHYWLKLINMGELTVEDAAKELYEKAIVHGILGGNQ